MLRPSKMGSISSALLLLAASAASRPSDNDGGEGANGDPCLLPRESGVCRAAIRAFHFNPESKRCEMFAYGGCDGNDNRFSTLKDCHESCKHHLEDPADLSVHLRSDHCSQHPLLGRLPCRGYFPRFTFDPESLKCVSYVYGGCNAGDNVFTTAGECALACVVGAESIFGTKMAQLSRGLFLAPGGLNPAANKSSDVDDVCLLPPTSHHLISCLAYIEKWTFDSSQDACVRYIYGGCYGTENLFDSKEDCEKRCKAGNTEASVPLPDDLQEPPRSCFETLSDECPAGEMGRLRYGYNAEKGICMAYEACQDKGLSEMGNSFDTARECFRVCNPRKYILFYAEEKSADACSLEIDSGPCRMAIPAYAFNTKTKRCEKFLYGGCEGNANRFASVEECVNTCGGNSPPSLDGRCSQVTCKKNEIMFYEAKACKPITRPGECCPSSWDCSPWKERKNRKGECFFADSHHPNGKYYAPDSPVPEAEGGCRAGCFCRNEGVISCAVVDCFPFRKDGNSEKCFQIYDDRESCCSSTSACFDAAVPYLCELEGKSYIEGQIMYSISDPCTKCQCKKGWNGTVSGDFCSPVDCGFVANDMYLQMECQPIFKDGVCCPVQWICPEDFTPHSGKSLPVPPPITSVPNFDCPPGVERLPVPVVVANSIDSPLYFELAKGFPKHLRRDSFPSLKPSEVCLLPPPQGPCEGFKESWYFDIGQRKCRMFKYGGSDDQMVLLNVFESHQDCYDLCRDYLVDSFHGPSCEEARLDKEGPQMQDRCLLPGRHFKFDEETNKCVETSHMGCSANRDKSFGSINECEAKCVTVSEPPSQQKYPGKDPQCNAPVVIGRCKARLQRFYYDAATGLCNKFFYGGCGGSENNFVEKSECISRCVNSDQEARALVPQELHLSNPCDQMPEQGRCRARKPRYHHDPLTRQCKLFIYGGCGGNENNFENLSDCMERCEVDIAVQEEYGAVCDEPRDQGQSCAEGDGNSMWYFDSDLDDCLSLDFKGCGGNGNRFSSRDLCRLTCKLSRDDDDERGNVGGFGRSVIAEPSPRKRGGVPDICLQPVKVGMCRALIPRYFYNQTSRKCEGFNFGGCDANDNNFETIEDCRQSCENLAIPSSTRSLSPFGSSRPVQLPSGSVRPAQLPANIGEGSNYLSRCELRPDPGRCYAFFPSFYFNKDSGSCEQFVYGGCGGNSNRFQTEEECEHHCSGGQRQRLPHSRTSSPNTEENSGLNPGGECHFGNSTFKRGDVIRSLATGCRSCTCSSPPYLTCIEKTCPEWEKVSEDSSESSSEEDGGECSIPVYDEDDCCITSYRCEED